MLISNNHAVVVRYTLRFEAHHLCVYLNIHHKHAQTLDIGLIYLHYANLMYVLDMFKGWL